LSGPDDGYVGGYGRLARPARYAPSNNKNFCIINISLRYLIDITLISKMQEKLHLRGNWQTD